MSPTLYQKITYHRLFNLLSGIVPAAFFMLLVLVEAHDLSQLFLDPSRVATNTHFTASIASSVAQILFMSLVVLLFLIRKPPVSKAIGIQPRVSALAGTFLLMTLVLLPPPEPTLFQSILGLSLIATGSALSAVAISYLGRSFSIMAEARELITHGPYAFIRHPLYLAEEVAVLGAIVIFFSIPAVLLLFCHIAIQIQRIRNEETILRQAFPEYTAYMTRVSRIIPGVY
ncbi:MAG: isoprenylcysteine carboxylmethyltransferase family protein [Alphaproteobacteria bacterium]